MAKQSAAAAKQTDVKTGEKSKVKVVMTTPMAGIGIDWPVDSEQELSPLSAYNLVKSGNAKYATKEDETASLAAFSAVKDVENA
jgi:hypothetical protein